MFLDKERAQDWLGLKELVASDQDNTRLVLLSRLTRE